MKEINDLISSIKSRKEEISVGPAELEFRQEFWGNEEISLVATVEHYNLSRPSRGLVGWWRFKVVLETLNLRGLWIIVDNLETIRNEKKRCGGGDGLDFGPFGFFKSKEEVQTEILEKKVSNFFQEENLGGFPKLPKPLRRLFVQSLTGRIKGVADYISRLSGFLMPYDSRIEVIRLSELLNRTSSTFSFFKEKRWEWVRKSGVIHFGNTYIDAVEPHFLPDGCNSQPIGVWEWGRRRRQLDVSTLHLLFLGAKEYRSLLQRRAKSFSLKVPRFQWEYLLEKWG